MLVSAVYSSTTSVMAWLRLATSVLNLVRRSIVSFSGVLNQYDHHHHSLIAQYCMERSPESFC